MFSQDKASIVLFSKWPENNLYYVVDLLKLDEKKDRCFVKYEDETECWVSRQDVHIQFNRSIFPYQDHDDIFCCLCDKDNSENSNEIVLCDVCQQGYHQACHQPKIRQVVIDSSTQEWECQTCVYIMRQLDPMPNTSTPKAKPRPKKSQSPRRTVLKSQANKQSRIKLDRDNADKKSSQDKVKTMPVAESSVESVPGDPSDESPELPLRELPAEAILDGGDNKIIETAKALVENIGTTDFVEAIEKAEPKAKATTAKTNGKIPKRVVTKKTKAKIPLPA